MASGEYLGRLCSSLCLTGEVSSITCQTYYLGKQAVFSGQVINTSLVFKSPKHQAKYEFIPQNEVIENIYLDENEFIELIKSSVKEKFNINVNDAWVQKISHMQGVGGKGAHPRHIEMNNIWMLVQSNEYLATVLYQQFHIFPELMGSCGTLYAVEKMQMLTDYTHFLNLYDSLHNWRARVKISLAILDYLQVLEQGVPEPLYICDVKLNHFGTTMDLSKIKYLDLDSVHPLSVLNVILADGAPCSEHTDCDYFDCRSFCNMVTSKCQNGVANNNLQIVCERIFLGWNMSQKIVMGGLLLGFHAPEELVELLERCANPAQEYPISRTKASLEIYRRLYNMLSHIHSSINT